MKTIQEKLDDIQKEAETKVKHAIKAHEVISSLPKHILEKYVTPSVHFTKLYGTTLWLNFKRCNYETLRDGKENPDRSLLRELLTLFPPIDAIKHHDGCTSFRPILEGFDSTELTGTIENIYGVTVRVNPSEYSNEAKFEWYTYAGEEVYKISVEFSIWEVTAGKLTLHYNRYGGHYGEISSVERCEYDVPYPGNRVKYASGDRKTPNTFVVFWPEDNYPDITELVRDKESA